MLHVVCYSGGIESALSTIEVVRKYGKQNVILLNHDICPEAEDQDIKQYKKDIADYVGLEVTPCNATAEFPHLDPLRACIDIKGFKFGQTRELCTYLLKTKPFMKWLADKSQEDTTIYYGFTHEELHRCDRRDEAMKGWRLDYPLLWKNRTIHDTAEIGIPKPEHYRIWKHGNCAGCLKAGWQHWYCTYCLRRDRWELAKKAEEEIGYAINRRSYGKKSIPCRLIERESEFEALRRAGIPATEWMPSGQFWSMARKLLDQRQLEFNFDDTE